MEKYKILVCGGREYNDASYLNKVLCELSTDKDVVIIQGGARGADSLAKEWAMNTGVEFIEVKADWNRHGKSAGPIRNNEMLKLKPDLVVAFPGGRGTDNMVMQASKACVPIVDHRMKGKR